MYNSPKLWRKKLPIPSKEGNKYTRGHAIVVGGGISSTGAARLAAISALRMGAGLVTVTSSPEALPIYASHLTAVMVKETPTLKSFEKFLNDERKNAVVIGPGSGVNEDTKKKTLAILEMGKNVVIDADAITVFQKNPKQLFRAIKRSEANVVLTPHKGEYGRIFHKEEDIIEAAEESGAVILFKGSNTLIASPEGKKIINHNAPPTLATAGSGDVLSGMIAGLLAQDVEGFDATAIAAWMHGEAANEFGYGLISEDLPGLIPEILQRLFDK